MTPQLHVTWLTAGVVAAVCLGVGGLVATELRARRAGATLREVGVVLGLFALWMLVGQLVGHHPAGGYARGDDIWRLERSLQLDAEPAMQTPLLGHRYLLEAANYYYAYAHWLSVDVALAWLWWRHRSGYAVTRNALVLFTGACLLLHLISTAPPRLLPQTHVVDTGARLGQSVYADTPGISDHLSAMPSVHVGWAVLFAIAAWQSGSRAGRLVATLHALLTAYVVVVTGNHFWLDGIVAAVIVVGAWVLARRLSGERVHDRLALIERPASTDREGVTV
ncbi:MAG: phosphatase PAP2 family protein [Frankiales bacterium]|nr:phosphatase PAP2 family protein [Frankiales bacterium]